jgi:hypothetical protein
MAVPSQLEEIERVAGGLSFPNLHGLTYSVFDW